MPYVSKPEFPYGSAAIAWSILFKHILVHCGLHIIVEFVFEKMEPLMNKITAYADNAARFMKKLVIPATVAAIASI